jgi:uncharacterized lipoprotein YajG
MKLPLVLFAAATLLLQSGCVTGRRTLALTIPSGEAPAATKGKVYIAAITDDRVFQNKPSDPSIPSIDGDVTTLSAHQKDVMIGRQRNTWGHAMGDIGLSDNDSVTKRVQQLIEEGLKRSGYEVTSSPDAPNSVTVSIGQFWAWSTPGFWAQTFEAKINTKVTLKTAAGSSSFVVLGLGTNHGQVAKDGNWQEAYLPAFEDYLTNFKREMGKIDLH